MKRKKLSSHLKKLLSHSTFKYYKNFEKLESLVSFVEQKLGVTDDSFKINSYFQLP